ncbi:MAG: enoyl-CoA hydratase [Rhodospirillaceae bacterium]|nr:enoyl-CoA hydratase [Rhodospirillaceae bacterium]
MSSEYRIFGAEMSPYSVKVRAYFRYKGIPHQWLSRRANEEDFQKYARLPIVPLVVTPDGTGIQDSTPIMEKLEADFPEPSIHPEDPDLNFLSALIEEYGDEWGNKLMFHHRWFGEADQLATAHVLARGGMPDASWEEVDKAASSVRERMVSRVHFTGSSPENAPLISSYLDQLLKILKLHLVDRKYLFGARPAFADFGLGLQVYEMALDPTAGAIIRARAPEVLAWAYRMTEPRNDGPFENWKSLKLTLEPLLRDAGEFFLPWSTANAKALEAGDESFSVSLGGKAYVQGPQKYHARSLNVLRSRYEAVSDKSKLVSILGETGCLSYLT